MRALIIGPDEQAAIRKVVAHAMDPEHWYDARAAKDGTVPVPGDNPKFRVRVPDGFRCVFTYTKHDGKLFRHLTVSVPGTMLPSPEAVILLAQEFGFTVTHPANAPANTFNLVERMEHDGWMVSTGHEGENCIVAVQRIWMEADGMAGN